MKRNTMLIIAGALLLAGVAAWAAFFRGQEDGEPALLPEERRIVQEIDAANHCETTEDCAQAAAAVCPFGCYVNVHKDEAARIGKMLVDYQNMSGSRTCMYSCIEYPGVDCVRGKCELRQP